MCSNWNTALQPARLGVWTMDDRDLGTIEEYRSYINDTMAAVNAVCTY